MNGSKSSWFWRAFVPHRHSFYQFDLDDFNYLGGSRETVNLMHLNLSISNWNSFPFLTISWLFVPFCLNGSKSSWFWRAFVPHLHSFYQFDLDDFNYLGGSMETVNLTHLNLSIIGILFHSLQFLDFLWAFACSIGWMAANPVDFGEPLYATAILFTNLWRLEGEMRSKSCLIIGFAVVKVARKKIVIVEMISILVYMLVKLDYFFGS